MQGLAVGGVRASLATLLSLLRSNKVAGRHFLGTVPLGTLAVTGFRADS